MTSQIEAHEYDPTNRYIKTNSILGRGAYKTVYRAIDRDLGIEVAWNEIKIAEDANFENFWKEIEILKQLHHPNVLECHYSWIDEKNLKIVFITEWMTSCTLRQFVKKAKYVKLRVIKNWCIQILEGLNYLHTQHPPIIHRDIKCDNIFIDGNSGRVKIGDLGLATSILDHCSRNKLSIIGTPEFMAPEYYEENYNEKVDIWAFGMCVLEMTTLEYPFIECTNPAHIFKRVIHGQKPQSLERILNVDVRDFIMECLKPVNERKSASKLLQHPFLQNIDSESNNQIISLMEKRLLIKEKSNESADEQQNVYDTNDAMTNVGRKCRSNEHLKTKTDILSTYHSKIKPILVDMPDDMHPKDIDITIHDASADPLVKPTILTLGLSLGVGSELTYVEFEYDRDKDTPADVAKEMVHELELSESSTDDIRDYIGAKVEEYYENVHRIHHDSYTNRLYRLKRSYSEGQPLIVARKRDDETFLTKPLRRLSPVSESNLNNVPGVMLDECEDIDLAGIHEHEEKSTDILYKLKMIVESNKASCDAALKAFEKKLNMA